MRKRALDIVVISDVNLGHDLCHSNELKAYLSSIRPKRLILNGDFIYNTSGSKRNFSAIEIGIIKKLIDMASNGTEIIYISGEKDDLGTKHKHLNLNSFNFKREVVLDIDGKKAWFVHGDTLNPFNTLNKWLFGLGSLGMQLKRLVNRIKDKFSKGLEGLNKEFSNFNSNIIDKFERGLTLFAIDKGYSFVICGHTHRPKKEILETKKGKCTYLNSGDWITNLTALEYTFRRWKIYNYSHDKLSPFFADEDLKKMEVNELFSKWVKSTEKKQKNHK
ncbi:UDP-2,3-diacylglucosamine diphosphatase [Eudoraea chungangensis]|uniref:UDP-2,3-diacylglucosamine diphosphatase n=1 Tax=Eudoraea chungangensis TaxID=1481905 RepID=UPI0023ED2B83|nr:UDP-2,3-diacylglucosamine diphosphatase [Eudoraea chungangensis]